MPSPLRTRALPPRRLALALSVALGVATFEGAAQLMLRVDGLFVHLPGDNDVAWRQRWRRAHAGDRALAFDLDLHHPVLGWTTRAGLRIENYQGGKRLTTNSRGLRGTAEPSSAKPAGVRRIVVLGDSFTFGEEVDDEETYCAQLERQLPGTQIVNLGVRGYGHDQMLLFYREEGRRYEADVVLLGFVDYDVGRNTLGFRSFAKPRFVLRRSGLMLTGVPVPRPEEVLAAPAPRFYGPDLLSMFWRPVDRVLHEESLTWAIADALVAEIRAAGAVPVLVDLPTGKSLAEKGWKRRFVVDYGRARGVLATSLRPFVHRKMEEGADFVTGLRHWDAAGHRLVAEGIREFLVRHWGGLTATTTRLRGVEGT
jgi:hypothetical protein